jgi:threonine dehydrogenase-like Zn-dependent dehydrogenase
MADRARAFWIAEPGRGEIRDESVPPPAEGDVLVRALFSGISRGTESLVFHGRVPRSEYGRMRAPFQAGEFPAPVKYGYANVGVVERGPRDVAGRTVFALYPHQTHFVVPATAACVVPDSVPPERAILAANLETAINGLWDLRPHVGDRITVIGAGTIGCLVAWLAAGIRGCEVELVDVERGRDEIARRLGVRFVEPGAATPGADAVVHCSGSAAGLELALAVAGTDSVVVEMSWYGDRSVPVPLGARFHSERLTIKSSQVGRVAESQRARWSHRRRLELALAMLNDPVLDGLITGESAFEELPVVMPMLAGNQGKTLCHRIRY